MDLGLLDSLKEKIISIPAGLLVLATFQTFRFGRKIGKFENTIENHGARIDQIEGEIGESLKGFTAEMKDMNQRLHHIEGYLKAKE